MLDGAHLVRVSPNALDNQASGGVLSTDQLPVLVGLDRHEPLILPGLKKRSTLRDSDMLPFSNSLQQSPCRRRIRWFLHVVCLIIALGYCGDVLRRHNGERLRWYHGERLWRHHSERLRLGEDEGLLVVYYLVCHC